MFAPKLVTALREYRREDALADTTAGVIVGIVALPLAIAFAIANVSAETREPHDVADTPAGDGASRPVGRPAPSPGVEVYEVNGPFFFGAAEAFTDTPARLAGTPRVLVIRMRAVPAMDATGIHALRDVVRRSRRDGTLVLISEIHTQPLLALSRSAALDEIGEDSLFGTLDAALAHARVHLDGAPADAPRRSA